MDSDSEDGRGEWSSRAWRRGGTVVYWEKRGCQHRGEDKERPGYLVSCLSHTGSLTVQNLQWRYLVHRIKNLLHSSRCDMVRHSILRLYFHSPVSHENMDTYSWNISPYHTLTHVIIISAKVIYFQSLILAAEGVPLISRAVYDQRKSCDQASQSASSKLTNCYSWTSMVT
jgi:hypothetical protein